MALLYNFSEMTNMEPENTWNFSRLDKLTIAAFLDERKAVWSVILLMYSYTAVAYYFLYSFSSRMSEFEFYSSNEFIDRFVANHSLIITGINQKISCKDAARKVKKVFDYRFRQEETKVVSCNTFHKTDNVQKHWHKVKKY